MIKVSTPQPVSDFLAEAIRLVSVGDRVILVHDAQELAALISVEELRWFEALEERLDNAAADAALREMAETGLSPIPFSEICKDI